MSGTYVDNTAGITETIGTGDYVWADDIDTFESLEDLTDNESYSYKIRFLDSDNGTDFERGLGTWDAATETLSRDEIYASSNNGLAVNWGVGQKVIVIVEDTKMATDMEKMVEGATKKILTVSERNSISNSASKLSLITVTQAVDLDQMEADIAATSSGMTYKGNWDATTAVFPGGGTARIGDFYYVSVGGTVGGVEFAVGDNVVATANNASTTTYAGNWSKHDQSDAVQSVAGLTGSISQLELRDAMGIVDPKRDAVSTAPIVIGAFGNSNCGGGLGGAEVALPINDRVFVYQASANGLSTGTWEVPNPDGTSILGNERVCGYVRNFAGEGQGTQWLAAADLIQRATGRDVFVITGWKGGGYSKWWNPTTMTDSDATTTGGAYNMWWWCTEIIANALTALQSANVSGSTHTITTLDAVFCDIAAGNCLQTLKNGDVNDVYETTYTGLEEWTRLEASQNYCDDMLAFMEAAQNNATRGGWSSPFTTKWFFTAPPNCLINIKTDGVSTPRTILRDFDGNARLMAASRDLCYEVPTPRGETGDDPGVVDDLHWRNSTQLLIGSVAGRMYLEETSRAPSALYDQTADGDSIVTGDSTAANFNATAGGFYGPATSSGQAVSIGTQAGDAITGTGNIAEFVNEGTEKVRVEDDGSMTISVESSTFKTFGFGSVGNIGTIAGGMRFIESSQTLALFTTSGANDHHLTIGPTYAGLFTSFSTFDGLMLTNDSGTMVLTSGFIGAPSTAANAFKLKSTSNHFDDGTGSRFTSLAGTLSRRVVTGATGTLAATGQGVTYVTGSQTTTSNALTGIPGLDYTPADGEDGVFEVTIRARRTAGGRGTFYGKYSFSYHRAGSTVTCSAGAFVSHAVTLTASDGGNTGTGSSTLVVKAVDLNLSLTTGLSISVAANNSETWVWEAEGHRRVLS